MSPPSFWTRVLGPEYLGSDQLGGILGRGIFLTETLGPVYLVLYQLGGILVRGIFLED